MRFSWLSCSHPLACSAIALSLPSALLRLLLCTILLLNGAGDAAARAWAQAAANAHGPVASSASHGHDAHASMHHRPGHAQADCQMHLRTAPACGQAMEGAHQQHGEHCCASSECHCAAASQVIVPALPTLVHPHAPASRALAFDARTRGAPAVPPLIRPPIR